jgi:hypothetical protein
MENFSIFLVLLVYLWSFGIFVVFWYIFALFVCCTTKNLATQDFEQVRRKAVLYLGRGVPGRQTFDRQLFSR